MTEDAVLLRCRACRAVNRVPAGKEKSLEDAVNICITVALKGKALDKKSQQMHDMVAYIHSLGKAPMKHSSGY